MVGSTLYITSAKPLALPVEQRLRAFVDAHSATVAFVRTVDGEMAMIETSTPQQAKRIASALASSDVSPEPLVAVLDNTPEGRDLERRYIELKQRELENQWANRQL